MNAKQAWRLAALISAACWCGLAAAQEPGRPRKEGVLIDDLPGKDDLRRIGAEIRHAEAVVELQMLLEVQQAQLKTQVEQFRESAERELNFIGRACPLAPDERQALDKAVAKMKGEFESLLFKQARGGNVQMGGAQRMAVANGRIVAPDARGDLITFSPGALACAQLEVAVRDALSKESLAKLEAERERRKKRAQAAGALAVLAAIDEAVLLDGGQVEAFRDYLGDNGTPVRVQLAAIKSARAAATPLQLARARLLSVVVDRLDVRFARSLRPAQFAIWCELSEWRRMMRESNAQQPKRVAMRRVRKVGGKLVVEAVAPPNPPPARLARAALGERNLAEQDRAVTVSAPAAEPPRELTLLLNLLVEDAATVGQLSEEQRETLLLAGKLDLGHYCAEEEARAREAPRPAQDEQRNQQLPPQSQPAATRNPFAAADSRFRKALASRLDQEQLARLAVADRKRRELRREAAVQSLVRQLDEAAKLTSAQWDALADAIRRRQQLSAAAVADDFQSESDACVSWLAKADLQPILDADQWSAVEQKLIELKRAASAAAAPGAPRR
jgi:hypothetical protein